MAYYNIVLLNKSNLLRQNIQIRGVAMGAGQTYPILTDFFQPKQKEFSQPHLAYPIFILKWDFFGTMGYTCPLCRVKTTGFISAYLMVDNLPMESPSFNIVFKHSLELVENDEMFWAMSMMQDVMDRSSKKLNFVSSILLSLSLLL